MTRAARGWWTALQVLLLVATLVWGGAALRAQWAQLRQVAAATPIGWGWVVIASVIVLGTYAMLIQSWRMLLAGWGSPLGYAAAVRVWTIANLGRWIPGKVWSVGALGVLARREGVSGVSAAGAAILGTLLNLGAGFGILAVSGTRVLGVFRPWLQTAAMAVSVCFVIGTLALPRILPPVLARVARWRGIAGPDRQLPAGTLWLSTAINALSWVCYGLAFAALARGITPQLTASPSVFIVVWTSSYLLGYLALFAPGGLVVREGVIVAGFVALGLAGNADATLLALGSRLWLTVLEILPGLIALLVSADWMRPAAGRTP